MGMQYRIDTREGCVFRSDLAGRFIGQEWRSLQFTTLKSRKTREDYAEMVSGCSEEREAAITCYMIARDELIERGLITEE